MITWQKFVISLAAGVSIILVTLIGLTAFDVIGPGAVKHADPPFGYEIVVSQHGEYAARWIRSGTILESLGKPFKTRQEAIDRAWRQHNYENSLKDKVWVPVDTEHKDLKSLISDGDL